MTNIVRGFVFLFVLIIAAPALADEPLTCPAHDADRGKKHDLDHVSIFDGDPDDQADLAPDEGKWNLTDYRRDDRELFLVCYYKKGGGPKTFLIPRDAGLCKLKGKNVICD